jgi:hypothetical protein
MKCTRALFTAVFCTTIIGVSCSKLESREPIAQVFGKDILISDLDPTVDELKIARRSYRKVSEEELLTKVRSKKLASLIWIPIMDEFAKTHDVEPTEEEILSFTNSMKASKTDLRNAPIISPEMERKIYQPFVKNWKTSKALYEEFGGTVIFQQANPMEPVGAYRKLLEIHEKKSDFKIYDEKLHQQFWEYYVREHPFQLPPNQIDYSVPWWLKEPPSDAAK